MLVKRVQSFSLLNLKSHISISHFILPTLFTSDVCHLSERTTAINVNVLGFMSNLAENKNNKSKNLPISEDGKTLDEKAVEEIMKEIKIKAVRAREVGPSGWLDSPVKRANKRFLGNTLKAAVKHNTRKSDSEKFQSQKKLLELDYEKHPSRRPKFGDRKFLFKKPDKTNTDKSK